MESSQRARLRWVELYQKTKNARYVCRHCGVSAPTLRKWVRRYERHGIEGLRELSRRPHNSPARKVGTRQAQWILSLRKKRKLGARRIQNELRRLHSCSLSLAVIHKVLTQNDVKPLFRIRRKAEYKRYEKALPGERIQMDTCKIAPGIVQYTAVDDCTRYRVLAVYKRRTATNTLVFLDKVIEEMPFPIQRAQTDRGREFFAGVVQQKLIAHCIKFRPNKPRSPHLNGKVERSQQTDLGEFYATVNLRSKKLREQLQEWQHYYNWTRPHGSLGGKTPMDRYFELADNTPFSEEIENRYEPSTERFQEQNYQLDLQLRKLKRCV